MHSSEVRLVIAVTASLSATLLRGQPRFFRERGYRVFVVSSAGSEVERLCRDEGVTHVPVAMSRSIAPRGDVRSLGSLVQAFRSIRPTIVNAGTPKAGLLGTLAAQICRVPVRIYTLRGLRYRSESGGKRTVLRLAERLACSAAHRVIAVGPALRTRAVEDGLAAPRKITVLGAGSSNGIDLRHFSRESIDPSQTARLRRRFGIDPEDPVIGFVGRITTRKGIDELTAAWTVLRQRHPRLKLVLVGDVEEDDPPAPASLTQIRNDPRITVTGFQWDIRPYCGLFRMLILPTHTEGFPNVPLQAAAMGIPVIASRIPECADAVREGFNGLLVEPQNHHAIVHAVERYLNDPGRLDRHAHNGPVWAANFASERIWRALDEEYAGLLRRSIGE